MILSMLITSLMALPPMDKGRRDDLATAVVVAKVEGAYTRTAKVKWGTDTQYVLKVTVIESRKGDFKVGRVIYVHAEQTGSRPDGWAGPQGQNRIPAEGATATFYLQVGPMGSVRALTPNGID